MQVKDYIKFVRATDREPSRYSPYGGNDVKRNGMPEHLFNPSDEFINDRVEILSSMVQLQNQHMSYLSLKLDRKKKILLVN